MIVTFVDQMRTRGFAVESVCAVLREQGCQVAARTYRAWKTGAAPAARTVSDAHVVHALRATQTLPESLYGRRKMVAHLRRQGLAVAHCTVDRLMRAEGMNGVRRAKKCRGPGLMETTNQRLREEDGLHGCPQEVPRRAA